MDVSEDAVAIGRTSPGGPANFGVSNNEPINCALDISFGGAGQISSVPQITMLIGADSPAAKTRTDNTLKEFRIASPHYSNSEEPVLFAMASNNANSNHLYFGHGTGSANSLTQIDFKVNSATNVLSSQYDPQLSLIGIGVEYARLTLRNSGFSETFSGNFSSNLGATPSFNMAIGTVRYYAMDQNITQIALTNVDTNNSIAQTVQIYLSATSAYTIARTNGVTVNGGTATDLRFPNGTNATHSGSGVDILTIVVTRDSGGVIRVFGFMSGGH